MIEKFGSTLLTVLCIITFPEIQSSNVEIYRYPVNVARTQCHPVTKTWTGAWWKKETKTETVCREVYSVEQRDGRRCKPGWTDLETSCTKDLNECLTNKGGCPDVCVNTPGSFSCACRSGYKIKNKGPQCEDIDECTSKNGGCSQGCLNTEGSFVCSCTTGYNLQRDGSQCEDINECLSNNGDCTQSCHNSEGGFSCSCRAGYKLKGDGRQCDDINECSSSNGGCAHTCTNTVGSFLCSCNSGYRLNGKDCNVMQDCLINIGGCSQLCHNVEEGFQCTCKAGFRLMSSGQVCEDIDECSSSNGGCAHTCTNTVGSFLCSCNSGYRLNGSKRCEDVNECEYGNGGCQQICTNSVGSFECSCHTGYYLCGKACEDINECSTQNASCLHLCHNYAGGYICSCRAGYRLTDDQHQCEDINECLIGNGGCHHTCHNSEGNFTCSCRPGYQLMKDGFRCEDINECNENNGDCSQNCHNFPGTYSCNCNLGYLFAKDWHNCDDVNECAMDNGGCEHNCSNTAGSFSCFCMTGYDLHSDGRQCGDVDECQDNTTNSCDQQNGLCYNRIGYYECDCNRGFIQDKATMNHTCIAEGFFGGPWVVVRFTTVATSVIFFIAIVTSLIICRYYRSVTWIIDEEHRKILIRPEPCENIYETNLNIAGDNFICLSNGLHGNNMQGFHSTTSTLPFQMGTFVADIHTEDTVFNPEADDIVNQDSNKSSVNDNADLNDKSKCITESFSLTNFEVQNRASRTENVSFDEKVEEEETGFNNLDFGSLADNKEQDHPEFCLDELSMNHHPLDLDPRTGLNKTAEEDSAAVGAKDVKIEEDRKRNVETVDNFEDGDSDISEPRRFFAEDDFGMRSSCVYSSQEDINEQFLFYNHM